MAEHGGNKGTFKKFSILNLNYYSQSKYKLILPFLFSNFSHMLTTFLSQTDHTDHKSKLRVGSTKPCHFASFQICPVLTIVDQKQITHRDKTRQALYCNINLPRTNNIIQHITFLTIKFFFFLIFHLKFYIFSPNGFHGNHFSPSISKF